MNLTLRLLSGVLLPVALGCSSNEPAPQAAAPAPTAPAAPLAAAPASVAAPASPSETPKPAAPAPLATSEGSIDGVRVEVTELKRGAGETLSLRFTIVNGSSRGLIVSDFPMGDGGLITDSSAYMVGGVHLIDLEGKKKYFVARDSAGACVCSKFGSLKPGDRGNHWARFAAPPDSVERLTVVIPPFAPMDSVPVSR